MVDLQPSAKVNTHVERMNRYLPISAAHDQIYEEYQTGEDVLDLETEALTYALNALSKGAKCIILTGDAGHGKTHLCRRLLEKHSGYSSDEARKLLRTECDGVSIIPHVDSDRKDGIIIHKDFSEIEPSEAAAVLESYAATNNPMVVCANEGRLRAILNLPNGGESRQKLAELFRDSFKAGCTSADGVVHIINLNYQSVARSKGGKSPSLVARTLHAWVHDSRRWGSCNSCISSDICPIRRNRTLLAEEGAQSGVRIANIEKMFSTVERLGHVVTIREMLMLIAYFLTAGLRCDNVHQKGKARGWQHENIFYNLMFERPARIPQDRLYKGIPTLGVFKRLDPGAIADRTVDEVILNQGNAFTSKQLDLCFRIPIGSQLREIDAADGIDDLGGSPRSKLELLHENEVLSKVVAALRRRAFFDEVGAQISFMSRLGFRHGEEFLSMLEGSLTPQERVRIKNTVVAGLHGAQGLRIPGTATTLHLVDPAFGRATADAAIVASSIQTSSIKLIPARDSWEHSPWQIMDSVDWIDRTVVIRIEGAEAKRADLALDMLAFECVTRMASGYISEDFYSHEVRRIRTFLGKLAERGRTAGQITLFFNGAIQHVSIDENVIQVSGGNNNG